MLESLFSSCTRGNFLVCEPPHFWSARFFNVRVLIKCEIIFQKHLEILFYILSMWKTSSVLNSYQRLPEEYKLMHEMESVKNSKANTNTNTYNIGIIRGSNVRHAKRIFIRNIRNFSWISMRFLTIRLILESHIIYVWILLKASEVEKSSPLLL